MENTIFCTQISGWEPYHWFTFTIDYLIPIIGCLAIVCGGVWAVYQYFVDKNREFNSKILNNVYAPLFEALVQTEYQRRLGLKATKNRKQKHLYRVRNMPFFSYNSAQIGSQIPSFENKLIELVDDSKCLEYAPRDFVALLKAYYVLDQMEGSIAEKSKVKIQKKIRRHIIVGYKMYRKKLGLRDISIIRFTNSIYGWLWFW